MVDTVLVPVDDSEPSTKALEFAAEQYPDAKITALHVVDPAEFPVAGGIESAPVNYEELLEAHRERAEDLLAEAREVVEGRGVDLETRHVVGQVARSIVEYVEDEDVDHVVIGSHGRRGATRVLLGSVAESVTRRSPVPVTVVR